MAKSIVTSQEGERLHSHTGFVNEIEDGETTATIGEGEDHVHLIVRGKVLPAGKDGHTHRIATA